MYDDWIEPIRLVHKFSPESKFILREGGDFKLNNIYKLLSRVDPKYFHDEFDHTIDDLKLLQLYYGNEIENELGRVIIFDLGGKLDSPIICSASRLFERIDEGAKVKNDDKIIHWEYFDGCSDVLMAFESSGNILYFDHENGVALARPTPSIKP